MYMESLSAQPSERRLSAPRRATPEEACYAVVKLPGNRRLPPLVALVGGLLVVGCALYLTHLTTLMVPILGLVLVTWGSRRHLCIPLIAGGLLGGLGLGLVLTSAPLQLVSGDMAGGLFLEMFALGWFSIVVLSWLFTRSVQWWALIPGGMMALTGLVLFL